MNTNTLRDRLLIAGHTLLLGLFSLFGPARATDVTYDGIYQWSAGNFLSLHQDGTAIIATLYFTKDGNFTFPATAGGGTLPVAQLDVFDLMSGQVAGSTATINGTRFHRACYVGYNLTFNANDTISVTRTGQSNTAVADSAGIFCSAILGAEASTLTVPKIRFNPSPQRVWTYTDDNVNLGIPGVSPGAISLPNGDVRIYVRGTSGLDVYRSSDGLRFSREANLNVSGTDYTVLRRSNGIYYAYFLESAGGTHGIYVRTSGDGLNWSTASSTGLSGPYISVPSASMLADGRVRLVYPDSVGGGPRDPGIKSAISNDWTSFQVEPGIRLSQGPNGNQQGPSNPFFADPEMALKSDGEWLILLAIPPESGHAVIYYATSSDGLTWTPNTAAPLIDNGAGTNAFDPTTVPLGNGSFRVYYGAEVAASPGNRFIRSGVIKPK
jgi:hypothetical protein